MTLTQLEYVVAVDTHRHFGIAAEHCFVTQPTLSMQIQKLEDELGIRIFDRSRQPVMPTDIGIHIISKARIVLREADQIKQLIHEQQDTMSGEIRIGIIPTLAPYLLPSLFKHMRDTFPNVELIIKEAITEDVVLELKNNRLDCGLVVTPLEDSSITEDPLFYEELFLFVSKNNSLFSQKSINTRDINPDQLWLLEEGHCFRSQILNLCDLRKSADFQFKYETGNIDTLKRMVEKSDGMTILPELAVREFSKTEMRLIKNFKRPVPVREVSLVMHRDHLKTRLIQTLKEQIQNIIPKPMQKLHNRKLVDM
jgi:LysR family transcriptional regulator, hydrogen peroxide-inducible genes activator